MSSPVSLNTARQRLPVNPRRHKVPPEARKRVLKACNNCNLRRAKCSGGQPCERCTKTSRNCEYAVAEATVSVSRKEYDDLQQRCCLLEKCLQEAMPSGLRRSALIRKVESGQDIYQAHFSDIEQDAIEEHESTREGRILEDPDGTVRYLGESSGAAFLDRLREYMAMVFPLAFNTNWPGAINPDTTFIASLGRYQTHDSRPLLVSDVDSRIRPTADQVMLMLSNFCYFIQDGGSDATQSGGIYYWGNILQLMHEYLHVAKHTSDSPSSNQAVINAAFAVACQLNPSCAPEWDTGFGQTFFARARHLIGNPLDVSTIGDASVLALLGYYLLNNNRRDAAYVYVSVAMHILIVHGAHRAWMVDERGKRLFWTVYILDRWLSCLMGRPVMITDEAIKLDLPRESEGLPPMIGLRAHVELSRISDYVVSNVYDIARQGSEPTKVRACAQKALRMLRSWSNEIPEILRPTEEVLSSDRAVCELQMFHNQLLILMVRPSLFIAVKKVTADICLTGRTANREDLRHYDIEESASAARENIHLTQRLLEMRRPANLPHSSLHHLFNAAMTLELYQILTDSRPGNDEQLVSSAIIVLQMDASGNNEYARDCAKVLVDLSSIMARLQSTVSVARNQGDLNDEHDSVPLQRSAVGMLPSPTTTANSSRAWQTANASHVPNPLRDAHLSDADDNYREQHEMAYNELVSWLEADPLQYIGSVTGEQ